MAETLALAVGVPAVLAAACLASRRSWSPAYADNRGIALQTVIVIVVMLVIAGGVAGVLFTRGAEVTGQLEATEVAVQDATASVGGCEAAGTALLRRAGYTGTVTFTSSTTAADADGDVNYNAGSCSVFRTAGNMTAAMCAGASTGGTGSLNTATTICTIA